MKIIIYEDEKDFSAYLENLINNYLEEKHNHTRVCLNTGSEKEIINFVKTCDENCIFFLDLIIINGDIEKTCLDVAKCIKEKNKDHIIIYVTNYLENIIDSSEYKMLSLNLIRKESSFFELEIIETLKEAINIQSKKGILLLTQNNSNINYVKFDDIFYIENLKNSNNICIFHINGIIEIKSTLNKIINELDERFCRCHKGFIVNMNKIRKIDVHNRLIYFDFNFTCPFSRLNRKVFINDYNNFIK